MKLSGAVLVQSHFHPLHTENSLQDLLFSEVRFVMEILVFPAEMTDLMVCIRRTTSVTEPGEIVCISLFFEAPPPSIAVADTVAFFQTIYIRSQRTHL